MSLPIERVDPDDLISQAGYIDGYASAIETLQGVCSARDIAERTRADAESRRRCAAYIRFLESRLYGEPKP